MLILQTHLLTNFWFCKDLNDSDMDSMVGVRALVTGVSDFTKPMDAMASACRAFASSAIITWQLPELHTRSMSSSTYKYSITPSLPQLL